MTHTGILYIVGTPIGNLDDIGLRALGVLGSVDMIVCEDTRVTSKLLKHYKISKPLKQFHAHTRFFYLDPNSRVAYTSDAGTPGLSDPGARLVAMAREIGMSVVPIPGPSALTALLSVASVLIGEFTFLGFPPHKKGRETFFKKVAESKIPVIIYEAPTRVKKALTLLEKFSPTKQVTIGRELTKKFEEILLGTPTEHLAYFASNPSRLRGEFVILVS